MPAPAVSTEKISSAVDARADSVPLCVDLDGTLVRTDLLAECLIKLVKRNPLYVILIAVWILRGRSVLKAELASRVISNPGLLPYNLELLEWLKSEKKRGRSIWLCTASNELLASHVASHLNIFDGVLASDRKRNLAGETKAAKLVERFGEAGFEYCGNEWRDIAIWKVSRGAIVVQGSQRLTIRVTRHVPVRQVFPRQVSKVNALIRALRLHQWSKNVLVFVPLLAAHQLTHMSVNANAVLAFIAFCFCASSVYIVNDLLDLDADRAHVRKSKRPFAAGDLSPFLGLVIASGLLGLAMLITMILPANFLLALGTYYVLTIAYSWLLKGLVLIDVLVLATLYTLRIVAGAAAVGYPVSLWMLLFSVFLFLSLALVKRFAELDSLRRRQLIKAAGRDYSAEDLHVLRSLGSTAGYLSVLIIALYINSPEIKMLYQRPAVLWFLCLLTLYWVSHIWMTTERGAMHDDPIIFALRDRASLAVGVLSAITVIAAI